MKNSLKPVNLILAFILALMPIAAYSITIEEFLAIYPNSVIALSANYYPDGLDTPARGSSGLTDRDPYALSNGNVILFRDLYESRIVPSKTLSDLIKKGDTSIDLLSSKILLGSTDLSTRKYSENFRNQEQTIITDEQGYQIIEKFFGKVYDGNSISYAKGRRPDFILQLAIYPVTRGDSVTDGISRINGVDPTPPIYGDVE